MKYSLAVVLTTVILFSCVREELVTVEPESSAETVAEETGTFVCGEIRVLLSEELTARIEVFTEAGAQATKAFGSNSILDELGIVQMYRLFPYAGEYEPRTRKEGLHRWYVVKYSTDVPLTKAQKSLEAIDGVEIFEPVRQIRISDFDDLTPDLWGLSNTTLKGFDINVKPVWENYTTGNPDVIVSVVDDGIDLYHEDLAANCLTSGNYNSVDGNSSIVAGTHGTHVAGTIAAVSNNGKGVAGIAGGDKANGKAGVKLMSCQIFKTTSDGATIQGNSAAAIKWGADNGAVISQNSWGYTFDVDGDGQLTGDELTNALNARISGSDKAAVDYFIKYAGCDNSGNQRTDSPMKGGIVIFAAGNDNIPMGAPAEYDKIVAVGAVAADGTKSAFSNYGDWVDICAPGTNILSTLPNHRYGSLNGTSMSCPHVSGVAALIVSYFGGPGFTNEMLKERLLASSNKSIISSSHQIGGLLDAYGAFVYGNDKAPGAVTDLIVSGRGNNLDLEWTVTADEDGKPAYGYMAIYGTDRDKVEVATPADLGSVGAVPFVPELPVGEKAEFSIKGLEFEKEYYVKILAYSYGRNYSDASDVLSSQTTGNNAPVINVMAEDEISLMPSETLNITVEIVEPDGHQVEVSYKKGSDAETFTLNPDGNWRFQIKGSAAGMGTYTSVVTATDEYGLATVSNIVYTIRENRAPEKIKEIDDILITTKGKDFVIDMEGYVKDLDGEQLKYEVITDNPKIVHINPKGNQMLCTTLAYGLVNVTIKASDARGESVSFSFKVQVKDPSKPLSVYPNPVTDYLNVGTLDLAETTIAIYSAAGKQMYENTSQVSGMQPARINMTDFAPGVYLLEARFGGKEYVQNIVKL